MTRIVLLRHAHSIANGKGILAGRAVGVKLSEKGLAQSIELAAQLIGISFSEIRISPMQRCSETVAPLIANLKDGKGAPKIIVDDDLAEVDYGKWTGKKLTSLYRHKLWKVIQSNPSAMYFPDGEGMAQMQSRALRALHNSVVDSNNRPKILVSHGDVIKSIVASVLGTHLDNFQKIVIDPASITVLDYQNGDFKVITVNQGVGSIKGLLGAEKNSKISRALLGGGAGRDR